MKNKNIMLFLMFLSFNIFMNPLFVKTISEIKIINSNKYIQKGYKIYKNYQLDSEGLVYGKILMDKYKWKNSEFLQFLKDKNKNYDLNIFDNTKTIKINSYDKNNLILEDYYQQYGLQGKIYSFCYNNLNIKNINIFYSINILISSLIFIYIIEWIILQFGFIPGIFAFISLICTPYLVLIIRNLYWISWTLYLPFAISIFNEKKIKNYYIIFSTSFFVILIKCLNGYEFISTLLISLEIGTCYYFFEGRYKIKEFIKRSFIIGIGGLLGFFFAIFFHIRSLTLYYGTLKIAIDKFLLPIKYRTDFGGDISHKLSSGMNLIYKESLESSLIKVIYIYLFKNFTILIFPMVIILLILIIAIKKDKMLKKNKPLLEIIGISFIGTLSWIILAKGHAYIHTHIDYILWSIPFSILVFAYIGKVIEQIFGRKCYQMKTQS